MALRQARAFQRQRCYLKARFVFNRGYSSLDAIVRNLSPAGARAAEADMREVPEAFDLLVVGPDGAMNRRQARSVWRDTREMGIAFLD